MRASLPRDREGKQRPVRGYREDVPVLCAQKCNMSLTRKGWFGEIIWMRGSSVLHTLAPGRLVALG